MDGFNAALQLFHSDPAAFHFLSCHEVPWHHTDEQGNQLLARGPVLGVRHVRAHDELQMSALRLNNDDRATVTFGATEMEHFYR